MGPFTGTAASIGQEQLKWAQLRALHAQQGERDELQAPRGGHPARRVAGVRPARRSSPPTETSWPSSARQEARRCRPSPGRTARLAYISASATNTSLTIGSKRIRRSSAWSATTPPRPSPTPRSSTTTCAGEPRLDHRRPDVLQRPARRTACRPTCAGSGATVTRESVNQNTDRLLVARDPHLERHAGRLPALAAREPGGDLLPAAPRAGRRPRSSSAPTALDAGRLPAGERLVRLGVRARHPQEHEPRPCRPIIAGFVKQYKAGAFRQLRAADLHGRAGRVRRASGRRARTARRRGPRCCGTRRG